MSENARECPSLSAQITYSSSSFIFLLELGRKNQSINNNWLHVYSAFLGTQSVLHTRGGYPQPPPVCSIHLNDATAAIVRQNAHHTPASP